VAEPPCFSRARPPGGCLSRRGQASVDNGLRSPASAFESSRKARPRSLGHTSATKHTQTKNHPPLHSTKARPSRTLPRARGVDEDGTEEWVTMATPRMPELGGPEVPNVSNLDVPWWEGENVVTKRPRYWKRSTLIELIEP